MTAMLQFYREVLQFDITDQELKDGEIDVAFLSQEPKEHHQLAFLNSDSGFGGSKHRVHFAFRADSLEVIQKLIARLDGLSIKTRPITHGNTWSVYFNDPEGNTLELFCDTPWQVDQPFSSSWDPNLSPAEIKQSTLDEIESRAGFGPNVRTSGN